MTRPHFRREAVGNDGLRQFMERLNATHDSEVDREIEIEDDVR